MAESLEVSVEDGVAQILLNRPEVMNRVDAALHRELPRALLGLHGRDDMRAVVLASTGRVFSAGGDIELMRAINSDVRARTRSIDEGRQVITALTNLSVPVVAALHGHAFGYGATIVLGCDAVVSAPGVKLCDPHVLMGLVAGDGGCLMWPQAIGMLRARRHLLTGDPVLAEDGLAMGLVTDLVDTPAEVLPAAHALAARIAALPPIAVQGTKRALNNVTSHRAAEVVDIAFALGVEAITSEDLIEATSAFKEKRPAKFQGR